MDPAAKVAIAVTAGLLYVAFIVGVILLSVRWSQRILKRKRDALLTGLPGAKLTQAATRSTLYGGAESEYEVDGQKVRVDARYVSRSFIRASLRVPSGPYPYLVVFPEGKLERLGKALGLNREVQTGDQAFDDLAYLDTLDTDQNVARVVESREVRAAMTELLELGYKVQLSEKGVEAFVLVYALDAVDGSRARLAVAALGRLAAALPSFAGQRLVPVHPYRRLVLALGLIFSWFIGVLLAGGLQGFTARTVDVGLVGLVFVVGGGLVWVAYVTALVLAFRGRSWAFRVLLVSAFVSLLGVPAGGGALLLGLNQWLDSSPGTEHPTTVAQHRKRKGNCTLTVSSWRGDGTVPLHFKHPGGDEVLPAGARVVVRTHPGAFGWEWHEPIAADGT
ncbi:MAG: hypothetical protein IPJ65_20760 [Archangiaceae bacterium]|nr:hypothetical protein [Archangiaceae bacterium]